MSIEEIEKKAQTDAIMNEAALKIREILDEAVEKLEEIASDSGEDEILEIVMD